MNQLMVRERRLITALGALVCVLAGGLWYSKREASTRAWAAGEYANTDGSIESLQAQKEVQQALVKSATDKATAFRDKFRPWALGHKELVQKMLDAGPSDMAVRNAVWDALPANDREAGFSARDFDGRADPPFAWIAAGKRHTLNDPHIQEFIRKSPKNAEMWKRSEEHAAKKNPQDFAEFRDLGIATSVNGGRYSVTLWASGRITKTYHTGKPPKPGRAGVDEVVTEVAPPYDFLNSRVPFNKDPESTTGE